MGRRTVIDVKTLMDNSGLRSGAAEAEGILDGFGKKAAAAVAVAAAVALTKGFTDALGQDQLAAKFGDDVVAESATIFRDAWGESLEEVATQYAETQRAFGDVSNLDTLTESAFILSEAFDRDVNASMQDAAELAESFGITGEEAFDALAVAMAGSTAEVREELSASVREYGGFFDGLGFSAEETLGLLTEFGEGGAMALDKSADALKELTIRGTDMSTASVAAYEAAGLSADDMAAALLAGGDTAQDAMKQIADGLLTIEDPADRANAAIALFGTPLEDLGVTEIPAFLAALQNMDAGMGDTSGATAALGEQLTDNLMSRLESVKRKGFGELADLINTHVVPALTSAFDWIQENWPKVQATIEDVTERIGEVVEEHWPQIRETIVEAVEAVQAAIERVIAVVSYIWERWGEEISAYAEKYWGLVKEVIGGALDIIQGVFRAFKALFEGDWQGLWDAVKQIVDGAWTILKAAIENLWNQVKLATSIAWDLIKTEVWDAIKAIPGLFIRAHFLLYQAGLNLLGQAKDGIVHVLGLLPGLISGAVTSFPGFIRDAVGDLFDLGERLFTRLKNGILEALKDLPEEIGKLVLGPLGEIASKIGDILGLGTGERLAAEAGGRTPGTVPKDDTVPDSVFLKASKFKPFHDGGVVMPNWSTGSLVGADEALILAQVGETVNPIGRGATGGGPFIGTLNVLERRTIAEELEVAWLLHGGRFN